MLVLANDDHDAIVLAVSIKTGDTKALAELLQAKPELAQATIGEGRRARTLLGMATDWPGYFPNGGAIVKLLLDAGADPDPPQDEPDETPLHWAASSDDDEVAAALLDGGADIEAQGGSIDGGSPLANAVGYGCWNVARLLLARGARVDALWQAAALGLAPLVDEYVDAGTVSQDDLDEAFWQACHGGQLRIAQRLLAAGADPNQHPDYADRSPLEVAVGTDTRHEALATWLREHGATEAAPEAT